MNVNAIDPVSSGSAAQTAAAAPPAKKAPPAAPAVSVASLVTPAATNQTTSVPATVKPEDRALYLQILKSLGGNVTAALVALEALQAKAASE